MVFEFFNGIFILNVCVKNTVHTVQKYIKTLFKCCIQRIIWTKLDGNLRHLLAGIKCRSLLGCWSGSVLKTGSRHEYLKVGQLEADMSEEKTIDTDKLSVKTLITHLAVSM